MESTGQQGWSELNATGPSGQAEFCGRKEAQSLRWICSGKIIPAECNMHGCTVSLEVGM